MLKRMREELREMMGQLPVSRPPVIRRSDEPDMLLATDLPLLTGEDSLLLFLRRAQENGWQTRMLKGWLLLDREPPLPRTEGQPSGQAACVLLLLQKHPGGGADRELLRRILKTAQQGPQRTERLMKELHGRFAAMLRRHEPLPEQLIPYIRYAASK